MRRAGGSLRLTVTGAGVATALFFVGIGAVLIFLALEHVFHGEGPVVPGIDRV